MATLKIEGGHPISGEITPLPNKNSILKLIPACVIANDIITLRNVPKSTSVRTLLRVFKELGGKVSYLKNNVVKLDPRPINSWRIPDDLASKERASLMFLGPLVARFGKAEIAKSGGCKLGNRPLDTMFQGLSALGIEIEQNDSYKLVTKGLKGNEKIWLMEASVTGTENLIIAATLAKGKTIIYNAACEPHTQDLCKFLNALGAQISGIGSNRLVIEGVEELKGGTDWTVMNDHLDVGGLIAIAAITNGELLIKDAVPEHMTQILNYFSKLNLAVEIRGDDIFVPSNQDLVCKRNVKGNIDKIMDQPWPGFPTDLLPQTLVLALKAKGTIKIFSNMYEEKLMFYRDLQKMHGEIILASPHLAIPFGPTEFRGAKITAPPALRETYSLIMAALAAKGETIIKNADAVFRGYPDVIEKLSNLGAKITMNKK
ncbi:UDP-N-acetylglucosamine 1-carboxyvinyltransferase [Candidatus Dojkabacteria bacterium]|nr:UDP-N-acetylglucosamine 1-carboxyvinyltransferase [Candidatus Dojkabacteria bacterium]